MDVFGLEAVAMCRRLHVSCALIGDSCRITCTVLLVCFFFVCLPFQLHVTSVTVPMAQRCLFLFYCTKTSDCGPRLTAAPRSSSVVPFNGNSLCNTKGIKDWVSVEMHATLCNQPAVAWDHFAFFSFMCTSLPWIFTQLLYLLLSDTNVDLQQIVLTASWLRNASTHQPGQSHGSVTGRSVIDVNNQLNFWPNKAATGCLCMQVC